MSINPKYAAKKIFKTASLWWFIFTVLFLLSLDFWSWERAIALSWFNLPSWVFYFVGLQLILALTLAIFSWQFWKTPQDEEPSR